MHQALDKSALFACAIPTMCNSTFGAFPQVVYYQCGGVAERLNATVLKTVRPRERSPGFESRPFRFPGSVVRPKGRPLAPCASRARAVREPGGRAKNARDGHRGHAKFTV